MFITYIIIIFVRSRVLNLKFIPIKWVKSLNNIYIYVQEAAYKEKSIKTVQVHARNL